MVKLIAMLFKSSLVRSFVPNLTRTFCLSSKPTTRDSLSLKNDREVIINFKNIPPKPKLPRTPAAIYLQERYTEMKKDDPSIRKADIKKTIENEWSQLEAKQPYQELAYKELKNYKEKKAVYDEFANRKITIGQMLNILIEFKKFEAQKSKEKTKNKPKKPKSAYHLFVKDMLSNSKDEERNLGIISGKWKVLTESEKQPYLRQAEESRKVYEKEYEKWKQAFA